MANQRIENVAKLLKKCSEHGIKTEKDLTDLDAEKFYDFFQTQKLTKAEADLLFQLKKAIQSKTIFAFIMGAED